MLCTGRIDKGFYFAATVYTHVGKQLARKVAEVIDATTPEKWLAAQNVPVQRILNVSPDRNSPLQDWDLTAPASSLVQLTGGKPLQATLYLCWAHQKHLLNGDGVTPVWIAAQPQAETGHDAHAGLDQAPRVLRQGTKAGRQ